MKLRKSERKKKLILDAAVGVFARKGFDNTRISAIATEANVAYGLVYHYFEGKDKILTVVFTDSWNVFLKVLEEIMSEDISFREKMFNVVSFLINTYITSPELIEVLIIEVIHSNRILTKEYLKGFMQSFNIFENALKEHMERNEIRKNINTRLATIMVFGALEMIFSGFALRGLKLEDFENEEQLKQNIVELLMRGLEGRDNGEE